ncbi:MAG: hypothetical protein AVDCRST_MAG83-58, partial [uncultured Arthrobacter sp.]
DQQQTGGSTRAEAHRSGGRPPRPCGGPAGAGHRCLQPGHVRRRRRWGGSPDPSRPRSRRPAGRGSGPDRRPPACRREKAPHLFRPARRPHAPGRGPARQPERHQSAGLPDRLL